MKILSKIFATVLMMSSAFDVRIYDDKCVLQAKYEAEQVYVNRDEAYIDLTFSNGSKFHIPFRYGVREVQVSIEGFFRSYQYENGKVIEKRDSFCKGSI